jgi:hypothetical protein
MEMRIKFEGSIWVHNATWDDAVIGVVHINGEDGIREQAPGMIGHEGATLGDLAMNSGRKEDHGQVGDM